MSRVLETDLKAVARLLGVIGLNSTDKAILREIEQWARHELDPAPKSAKNRLPPRHAWIKAEYLDQWVSGTDENARRTVAKSLAKMEGPGLKVRDRSRPVHANRSRTYRLPTLSEFADVICKHAGSDPIALARQFESLAEIERAGLTASSKESDTGSTM